MAWKARIFLGLMLTVMLIAIAGPVMADDNNRPERREDRREWRDEWRKDNLFINHHDGFHGCCKDFDLDEDEFLDNDLDFFAPLIYVVEFDVDCDGIDDRLDWWIGNGCVIEDVEIEPLFD